MNKITIAPILKLYKASSRPYITRGEYRQALTEVKNKVFQGSLDQAEKLIEYAVIMTKVLPEFDKQKKISKEAVLDKIEHVLGQRGYKFTAARKASTNKSFWTRHELADVYDLAYFNPGVTPRQGHHHEEQGQKSAFYFRCEIEAGTQRLLVGNLQQSQNDSKNKMLSHPGNIKKIMFQAAIAHARDQQRESIIFHAGATAQMAQQWEGMGPIIPKPGVLENPVITERNEAYYKESYARKMEILKNSKDIRVLGIRDQEFWVIEKTPTQLKLTPFRARKITPYPLQYLADFAAVAPVARELEGEFGPGTLDPQFKNDLHSTGVFEKLARPVSNELYELMKVKEFNALYHYIDNVFKEIGLPVPDAARQEAEKINFLTETYEKVYWPSCGFLMTYLENYLNTFGYNKLLLEKFTMLTEDPLAPKEIDPVWNFRKYVHKINPAPITIPLQLIHPPIRGEKYCTLLDFLRHPHTEKYFYSATPPLPQNRCYGIYRFYEKEIPQLARKYGYPCEKVELRKSDGRFRPPAQVRCYGWEIGISSGIENQWPTVIL